MVSEHTFNYPNFGDLNMHYCGRRIKALGHIYGPEIRTRCLLVLIKEGSATLFHEYGTQRMSEGQILVMFPGERVHYKVDEGVLWTISWIGLYGDKVNELLASAGITPQSPVHTVKDMSRVSDIMDRIYDMSMSQLTQDKLGCIGLLYEFFSQLVCVDNFGVRLDYVEESKYMVKSRFDRDITVGEIANMLHIPLCYLSRLFKEREGVSLKQYIIDTKLHRAVELMKNDGYTITEIANSVGVYDPLYFSRLFKKKMGVSPSVYRRMLANK